jgi:hypothetical protein
MHLLSIENRKERAGGAIYQSNNEKGTLEYTVCDYSSGTNIMTEDKRLFSIYF